MLKFHTAGESHGMYLVGILEGIPAGLKLNLDYINSMVLLRKRGYGRGKRMNFEEDKPEFFGGLTRDNITTGAPIGFRVRNIDWEKGGRGKFSSIPRPGHSDFSGSIKYDFENLYLPAERASGRLTVLDVIAGSICILFLKEFEVETYFFVTSVGGVSIPIEHSDGVDAIFKKAISSSVLVPFPEFEEKIMGEINHAIKEKDSLGGSGLVILKGVPAGLGDYNRWDKRIDGLIAQAIMSIPSVKAVEIGEGIESSRFKGSEFHDPFFIRGGKILRGSNNAGGIEGGITNGEDIIVKFYAKPIPTVRRGVPSVNFKEFKEVKSSYVRSDTVVIPAVSLIVASRVSFVIASTFLDKFGGDHIKDIKDSFNSYINSRRRFWQR
ncbi:MAG: chorismate synthase [Caldiserica bacterium]|nr:MAG: chorismate synthase [Caldisericota bacterium]